MSAYPELVRQMPCYEPRHMREHTARPHKLLYGFNGEMFWNIVLRGDPIEEEEEEVKYGPEKKFMQVLNKAADEIKTYPIKEGSSLYKGIGREA